MLSTIPNVKRAEISSPSPKSSSQTRSQHSPITVVGEANKNVNVSDNLASSYTNDDDDKVNNVSDEGVSFKQKETYKLNKDDTGVRDSSKFENCANKEPNKTSENNVRTSSFNPTTNISSNLSDMSRRKQRNPKPTLFSSLEDNNYNKKSENNMQILKQHDEDSICASEESCNDTSEDKHNPEEENVSQNTFKDVSSTIGNIADNGNSTYSSSRSSSSPTPPPHDLSSMVKVEVHEGSSVVETPNIIPSPEQNRTLFNHSTTSRLATNSLPTLTPMPSQQRPLLVPHPPLIMPTSGLPDEADVTGGNGIPFGLPLHLSKMMMSQPLGDVGQNIGASKEDMAAKHNNMFHFGDVSVAHHPDTAPVPMIIPMVYLYPLPPSIDKAG